MTCRSAGWRSSTPLGDEHHARPVAQRSVERADLPGDRPALVDDQHLDVRVPAAAGPRPGAPLVSSSRHCPSSRPSATSSRPKPPGGGRAVARAPARSKSSCRNRSARRRRRSRRPSARRSPAGGRAAPGRRRAAGPGSCARAGARRRRASPSRRCALSARSSGIACSATRRRVVADRPSEVVIVSTPGRPFIRPTRTVSFRCPAASVDSSSGSSRSTAVWTASPRSITALRLPEAVIALRTGAEAPLAELAGREGHDPQLELDDAACRPGRGRSGGRRAAGPTGRACPSGRPGPTGCRARG